MKLVAGQEKKEANKRLENLKAEMNTGGVFCDDTGAIIAASQYDQKFCEILLTAMQHGLDRKGAAGAIGISFETFEKWEADHPEFAEAAKVGESLSQLFWQKQGIKNLTYSPTGKQINSKLYSIFAKERLGWGEAKEDTKKQVRVLAFELNQKPTHLDE